MCHRFSGAKRCTSWQILSVRSGLNSASHTCDKRDGIGCAALQTVMATKTSTNPTASLLSQTMLCLR